MKKRVNSIFLLLLFLFNQFFFLALAQPAEANPNEANKIANKAHKAYVGKNYPKAGELYEKAYKTHQIKVFLDNAITAYLSYAFDLSNEKKYDKAIKYCEKSLRLRPADKNAKELLSDIYYSRGSDFYYRGFTDKALSDIQNSLKFSMLPEQSERARNMLTQVQGVTNSSPEKSRIVTSQTSNSIPDLIELMELKIYGETYEKNPIIQRVRRIEKDILMQTYNEDSLLTRVDRLKSLVLPELEDKKFSAYGNNNDYIQEVIEQSQGPVRIFGEMPILVYFNEPDAKVYKKYYEDVALEAMKEWEQASNGKVKFQVTNDPMKAQIKISWVDHFEDYDWTPKLYKEDINAEQKRLKYQKASMLVRIGSVMAMLVGAVTGVPVIGTVGAVGGSVASPLLGYKGLSLEDRKPEIKINTAITEGMTEQAARVKIKQIALHQIGHIIGIYAHSPDPNDIMYKNFSATTLSERDKNTIKEVYKAVGAQEE